jgi:hypothetical protein
MRAGTKTKNPIAHVPPTRATTPALRGDAAPVNVGVVEGLSAIVVGALLAVAVAAGVVEVR